MASVPTDLRTCGWTTSSLHRGTEILLDISCHRGGGVPKRVIIVRAEPNAVGTTQASDLVRFYCQGGIPLAVPLIVTRILRSNDVARSYETRAREITVWILWQSGSPNALQDRTNEALGLASDPRHYALDLLTYRTLMVRMTASR